MPKSDMVQADAPLKEEILEGGPKLPEPRDTPRGDEDLTAAEKKKFLDLIHSKMSLEERAERLAALARMRGSKTAAVGLRAIQTMNALDGFEDGESATAPPMFQLPPGSEVAIAVRTPKK